MWLLLVQTSCSENDVSRIDKPNGAEWPVIEVSPISVDLGTWSTGQAPAYGSFTIRNTGSGALELETVDISGEGYGSFTVFSQPAHSLLAEESTEVTVAFQDASGAQQAQARVRSSDPDTPVVEVALYGEGIAPGLDMVPSPLDLGSAYVNCHAEGQILLSSTGQEDLEIYTVELSGDGSITLQGEAAWPLSLAPGAFTSLDFVFEPESDMVSEAVLNVLSSDPSDGGVQQAQVSGTGLYGESHEQIWESAVAPPSDIIFSVDLSSSMTDEQDALAANFSLFIAELAAQSADWQIMVVNADHGCNHSGILTAGTPGYEDIFSEAVRTGAYDISFTEALLTAVANGVEKTDTGECNEGFLREGAMLHTIMVSDECEQSPNPGICGTQWQDYVDRIVAQKGDPSLVRLSAIAGDYPSGCGAPQTAEFGSGYYEASIETGGVFLSICQDWSDPASLGLLAAASVSESGYVLDHPAHPESIRVWVNETEVLGSWAYDEAEQKVAFQSDAPIGGDTVRIAYSEAVACGG
jgi:hypothetical protein